MEIEENHLIDLYHEIVQEWVDCKHNSDYIRIMAKINGGKHMKPGILFNYKTGKLKSKEDLKLITYNHLSYIFKSNTLNSENSKMLISNIEDFMSQGWSTNNLLEIKDDTNTEWRKDPSITELDVFFNLDFSLRTPLVRKNI